jgi:hypothetical protein
MMRSNIDSVDKNEVTRGKFRNESSTDVKKPSILLAEPHASVRDTVERALSEQNFVVIPVSDALLARQAQKREAEMGIIGPSLSDVGNLRRLGEQMREYSVRIPLLLLVPRSSPSPRSGPELTNIWDFPAARRN